MIGQRTALYDELSFVRALAVLGHKLVCCPLRFAHTTNERYISIERPREGQAETKSQQHSGISSNNAGNNYGTFSWITLNLPCDVTHIDGSTFSSPPTNSWSSHRTLPPGSLRSSSLCPPLLADAAFPVRPCPDPADLFFGKNNSVVVLSRRLVVSVARDLG